MKLSTIALAAALAFDGGTVFARTSFVPTPLPYSCEQVRMAAAAFTIEHLKKIGKELGIHLTGAQMREAEKCIVSAKK
jgi:hypothetical protein